ncbi:hypothetical protein [Methylosinus sp. PW1]|uniref:hypothetical protein n=1 Tax=Methylosinus sp. PW1 TaxID=107636 RepID=UPI0012EB6EE2|nr:hypothetical protein [Methylosinus sp. PW1]
MKKVTVYNVRKYDIVSDEIKRSRRMATREGALIMCAQIIEGSAIEIDESELESGEQWTRLDFRKSS